MHDHWRRGVGDAAAAVRAGTLTPVALVEALLARIERLDPEIEAWVRVAREQAIAQAHVATEEAKAGRFSGPLHGVPVAVKDNYDTAGIETNVGSRLLAGRVPTTDAAAVRRLHDAGAIVLGKTAMTVFAAMDPAATRNPWNREHTPGGSSSGSAAAVAAFMAPGAIGTQTAGSIIRPAAYCGVVGLKPTYGAIERDGIYPCAWSMDHAGPMARSVADVALLFGVLAGRDVPSPAPDALRGRVIGVPAGVFRDAASHETLAAFDEAMDWLRDAGAKVERVELPASFQAGVDAGIVTMYAEMAEAHASLYAAERERFAWKLAVLVDAGRGIAATDYVRAQRVRREAIADLEALFTRVDYLATASTPTPAPRGLDATGDWRFNLPFSSTGHPVLTVPIAVSAERLPIGLQLVARHGAESLLFDAGAAVERRAAMPPSPYLDR